MGIEKTIGLWLNEKSWMVSLDRAGCEKILHMLNVDNHSYADALAIAEKEADKRNIMLLDEYAYYKK